MYKEVFPNLIEIQSLENNIFEFNQKIKSHQLRVTNLENKRNLSQKKIKDFEIEIPLLQNKICSGENELNSLEQRIQQSKSHLAIAKTTQQLKASESEIKTLNDNKEKCEITLLENMEELEDIEQNLQDEIQFSKGSTLSLKEITQEVENDISKEKKEIHFVNERIQLFLDLLSPNVLSAFNSVNKRFKNDSPISVINNKKCHECGTEISGNIENQIQLGLAFEYCTGCGRILAPYQG